MSGVAVGEGLEGNGDASEAGLSFNEDGTRINGSNESLAGVGEASGGKSPSVGGALLRFSALLQCEKIAPDRCSNVLRSFFFGSGDGGS